MKGEFLRIATGIAVIRAEDSSKFEVNISEFKSDMHPNGQSRF